VTTSTATEPASQSVTSYTSKRARLSDFFKPCSKHGSAQGMGEDDEHEAYRRVA